MFDLIQAVCISTTTALLAALTLIIYRLYFHPLSRFPGPKLAAATKWYEFWYDVILPPGGQYSAMVERLHDKYGPIVRINPQELHIRDPDMYEQVYASSTKRDRWYNAARMTGKTSDSFSTIAHALHRQRRVANSPIMARRTVNAKEGILLAHAKALDANFQHAAESGEVLDLSVVFLGYSLDVAGAFFFGRDIGAQQDLGLARKWYTVSRSMSRITPIMKQFPSLAKVVAGLPSAVVKRLWPDAGVVADLEEQMLAWAVEFRSQEKRSIVTGGDMDMKTSTLFEVIDNSKLPEEEKSAHRLVDEGVGIIIAGSETTAKVLTRAAYELTSNPSVLLRAREELAAATRQRETPQLGLTELERLPYITALIKEALRITAIVTSRFPVQLYEPLHHNGFDIPAMTPISLTPASILHDSSLFPEPGAFRPERWLHDLSDAKSSLQERDSRLERYFVPFGKGSRMCQGVHLAWAELYYALALLITGFDLDPEDIVKERDIDFAGDYFVGGVRDDSLGVRVKVLNVV